MKQAKTRKTRVKDSHWCIAPSGRRKRRFRDHKEAVFALQGAKRFRMFDLELKGYSSREEDRVYSCPLCMGWHLTKESDGKNSKQDSYAEVLKRPPQF